MCYILKWRYQPRLGDPDRDTLVRAMRAEGIPLVDGYARLLHELPIFARRIAFGRDGAPAPVSQRAALLRHGNMPPLGRNQSAVPLVHPCAPAERPERYGRCREGVWKGSENMSLENQG